MPVQRTVATRPPAFVSARRFPACTALRCNDGQLSAGCAAHAADKPAAARPSLLFTRSRHPTRTPASPGCALSRARSFARACCPQRTLPHTRPARAALRRPRRRSDRRPVLSVVRRSLAQVLRLVAEGAVSASRSAARAPGAPVRGAVGGVEPSGPSSRRAIVRRPKHQRTHWAVSKSDLRAHRSSPGVWCLRVCARAPRARGPRARTRRGAPACAELLSLCPAPCSHDECACALDCSAV